MSSPSRPFRDPPPTAARVVSTETAEAISALFALNSSPPKTAALTPPSSAPSTPSTPSHKSFQDFFDDQKNPWSSQAGAASLLGKLRVYWNLYQSGPGLQNGTVSLANMKDSAWLHKHEEFILMGLRHWDKTGLFVPASFLQHVDKSTKNVVNSFFAYLSSDERLPELLQTKIGKGVLKQHFTPVETDSKDNLGNPTKKTAYLVKSSWDSPVMYPHFEAMGYYRNRGGKPVGSKHFAEGTTVYYTPVKMVKFLERVPVKREAATTEHNNPAKRVKK